MFRRCGWLNMTYFGVFAFEKFANHLLMTNSIPVRITEEDADRG